MISKTFIHIIVLATAVTFHCSQKDLESLATGCDVEEGKFNCKSLEASCAGESKEFIQWNDPNAEDGVKCECCEK
jgi:hypothetical protein